MSSYNTLIEVLPRYFRSVKEFQALMKAYGYALDNADVQVSQIWANMYISTCDEGTLAFWERVLGLKYTYGDTLDYRCSRIMQAFNNMGPFSLGYLNERLTDLYGANGYTVNIDYAAQTINIKVTSTRYGAIELLYNLLWDVVPAHYQIIANKQVVNNIGGSKLFTKGFAAVTRIRNIGGNE